jgi:hypothetical protein
MHLVRIYSVLFPARQSRRTSTLVRAARNMTLCQREPRIRKGMTTTCSLLKQLWVVEYGRAQRNVLPTPRLPDSSGHDLLICNAAGWSGE